MVLRNGTTSDSGSIDAPTTVDTRNPTSHTSQEDSQCSVNKRQISALLRRCRRLLAELDLFQSQINLALRNPQLVEVRQMRSNLVSELKALEKLQLMQLEALSQIGSSARPSSVRASAAPCSAFGVGATYQGDEENGVPAGLSLQLSHALRSSNLPFYEAVWTVAKRSCSGLVTFWRRFYWDEVSVLEDRETKTLNSIVDHSETNDAGKRLSKNKRRSVMVDIVADEGDEWVKVSTVSETRLLFEMAKKGWEVDSDSSENEADEIGKRIGAVVGDGEIDGGAEDPGHDEDEIQLIKLAVDMRKAASATRVRYRHPRIRFVMPRIVEGKVREIDRVLDEIRRQGIRVDCATSSSKIMKSSLDDELQGGTADGLHLSHLLPNPFKEFTSTLNVDCTLLLALVSDLSHLKNVPSSPNHHVAILRQIEVEKQRPLLPAELWPAMADRSLVCTKEAAMRMREIVSVIGTDSEKERALMLLGDPPYQHLDRQALLESFQQYSDYTLPAQWCIPIRTVAAKSVIEAAFAEEKLHPVAHQVAKVVSDINYSIFFYGWVTGMMTISSNRTVVRQIETEVEKNRHSDDNMTGPLVWVCDTARSLIGKEKVRKT